jgi:hypothetical protein
MDKALITRIEHAIAEQLKTALDDIITGVMEDQLECYDFETQYNANEDALANFEADIDQLAANCTESVRAAMVERIEALEVEMGERYEDEVLPAVKATHELDGVIDRPARRESWCNFIDDLNKSGELTEYEASRIDFDVESL